MVGGVWVRVVSRGSTRPEAEVEAGGAEKALPHFTRSFAGLLKKKEEPLAHGAPGKRKSGWLGF
jgi:hypothetical protein